MKNAVHENETNEFNREKLLTNEKEEEEEKKTIIVTNNKT